MSRERVWELLRGGVSQGFGWRRGCCEQEGPGASLAICRGWYVTSSDELDLGRRRRRRRDSRMEVFAV